MNDALQYRRRSIPSRGVEGRALSLLDALHESRRGQAVRAIDSYRHLLGEAKADESRWALEEVTRERVSIRSLCRIWQPHFSWISLLMKRVRAWTQGRSIIACKDQPDCCGRKAPKGTTNMSRRLSFHKAPPHSSAKPHLIDRGGRQYSTSGRMSVRTTVVIIASLVGFAVLHVVGGTLMMRASDRLLVEPAHMSRTD